MGHTQPVIREHAFSPGLTLVSEGEQSVSCPIQPRAVPAGVVCKLAAVLGIVQSYALQHVMNV